MMMILRAMVISAAASLMGACATQPNLMPTAEFAPVQPAPVAPTAAATGAIFNNGMGLFGDLRSYQGGDLKVGDLVTVLLSETTQASRSSDISTSRASTNDVVTEAQKDSVLSKIGRGTGFFSDFKLDGGTVTSDGTGTAGQAASLTGSISAMVVEVLSNGNLVILGEKQLALTEGSEFIRVKGIIRPADIQPDNTVLSRRIANAQISYRGTGDLAKASKPGWGTGLIFKFWPF
jgi:flagellar L-ring protein precursor FlgH